MIDGQPAEAAPSPSRSVLQHEWQAFWLAVGFLTRIPMLARIDYSQKLMNQCSMYFPVVGLLLGALYAGLFALLGLAWSPLVGVLLVLCFHLFITGAFHEDGLADSVDALGGGYTVEKRLEIMKDSRIGTYGTVALVMALLLKVALLTEANHIWLALLVAPAVSRLTPLLLMATLTYVTDPDKSKSKPVADGFSNARLAIAAAFVLALCILLSFWHPLLIISSLTAVLLVALSWGVYLRSQLGGYTGDALGASVVFSELVLLMLL
ncbi:adenosylcobinamide-GDP ribazoletransferase [Marinobacter sediminicola]|uniref:adenosylcobinamide-GDP ribazoletransferase n=1 Tax=Marinobacter sediminicola TaxID=3072994 RepID=UPI0028123D5B|nr:adenosylcobinamide-GDP ribazoletransferase [Marinobacter sp. F26243]